MKKILFISFAVCFIGFAFIINKTEKLIFTKRLERMNAHIKYLHDEDGYSWEAARKIGATEAGFIPVDSNYNALIED